MIHLQSSQFNRSPSRWSYGFVRLAVKRIASIRSYSLSSLVFFLLLSLLLPLAGCRSTGPLARTAVDAPNWIDQYNRRTNNVKQIWSRTVVEVRWQSPDGKKHFEQGDGVLIIRKPLDLAFNIGKQPFFDKYWLGSDGERFWLFDRRPPEGHPTSLHITRYDRPLITDQSTALPIRPDRLIELLGITPLPSLDNDQFKIGTHTLSPEKGTSRNPVARLIEIHHPATPLTIAMTQRLYLDPQTNHPTKIELLDTSTNQLIAHSVLRKHALLERDKVGRGAWPYIATSVAIFIPQHQMQLLLSFEQPTDGLADEKINDLQFDLPALTEMFAPARIYHRTRPD